MNRRIKEVLTAGGTIVLILIAALILFRGVIIRACVNDKIEAIEQKYSVKISYSKLRMDGLAGVSVNDISILQIGSDTLVTVSEFGVRLKSWKLLTMSVDIKSLKINELHVQFIKYDSCSNYDFLYNNLSMADSLELEETVSDLNLSRKLNRISNVLFGLVPSQAQMNNLRIDYIHNGYSLGVALDALDINDKKFDVEITVTESDSTHRWIVEGGIWDDENKISIKLYPESGSKTTLPFLDHRFSARISFDTLTMNLTEERVDRAVTDVNGQAAVCGLSVEHEGLSPDAVRLERAEIDYRLHVGRNFIELDSATVIQFNRIEFNPYLLAERDQKWRFKFCIDENRLEADALFSSLPKGLFLNLEGIKTEGELSYHMRFDLDMAQVDSLQLESQLEGRQFKIKQFGQTDLGRMNTPFTYTAYEKEEVVRSFEVGEGNPDFRPLNTISPILQMAVMQSEDGAFFSHNGFQIDCMRDALINDIKSGRFARGGSTISMQLVKNVFLSRHKTIVRKAEEALIVWLIEQKRISSKERMFEVYLNIIEWGPMIYGIGEASYFYFKKEPLELTLEESIFLASIIPAPKRALGSFDENMQLKSHFESIYRIIGERLARKGLITEEQAATLQPQVTLKGEAMQRLVERNNQKIINDSLMVNNPELLK